MTSISSAYQYEVKASAKIESKSESGRILRIKSLVLEVESNFPLTKTDLGKLEMQLRSEVRRHAVQSPKESLNLKKAKAAEKEKAPLRQDRIRG